MAALKHSISKSHCRNLLQILAGVLILFIGSQFISVGWGDEERARGLVLERTKAEVKAKIAQVNKERAEEPYRQGKEYYQRGELDQALREFKKALELNPAHRRARRYMKKIEKRIRKEAREKERKVRVKRKPEADKPSAEGYLRNGMDHYRRGRLSKAIEEWEKILNLTVPGDPCYRRAQYLIRTVRSEQMRRESEEIKRRSELEGETLLLEVDRAWLKPERVKREKEEVEIISGISEARRQLEARARAPVSPEFKNAHLRDVLRYLSEASGVDIILDETVFPSGEGLEGPFPRVTIRLKDVPLIETLDVILRTKGLRYRLEENVIWVSTPENLDRGELATETFSLSGGVGDMEEILGSAIPFEGGKVAGPKGSKLNVDRRTGTIIITNTPSNLEMARKIIRSLDIVPIQVEIEAKFIDLTDDGLKRFQIRLDDVVADRKFRLDFDSADDAAIDVDLALGSDDAFSSADEAGTGLSLWYVRTHDTAYTLILEALERSRESKLLSAPRVTTLNNQEALIEIYETFPFPEGYTVETETIKNLKYSVIKPGDIVRQKVGILLKVTPSVGGDRKVINLNLIPEISEQVDWINYSSEFSAYPKFYNFVKTPVFERRTATATINIGDGETVILGGLKKGKRAKTVSKVPILGDIPLLGYLFKRDTGRDEERRNLLIFVTARILTPAGERLRQ